jgi:hypothetical protein
VRCGGACTKGLVSFDRLTRKDPFYFYKANWSSTPVTYITGRLYTERAYRQTDVKVYSNARSATRFNTAVTNVADARDKMLWSTFRSGAFSYNLPLPNGRYQVTLGMLEPRRGAAAGSRVFDVAANGATAVAALDVFAQAGGHSTAIRRSFEVAVEQGSLLLEFQARVGEAVLSNIRITRR